MSTPDRTINQAGIDLICDSEKCKLKAYKCPAGVLTIGWGDTEGVTAGMIITQAEADSRLQKRLKEFCDAVNKLAPGASDDQFAAMVSLAYNIGIGAFRDSTLLRKFNAGDEIGAAKEFDRWNKAGGKVLPGLVIRRAAERHLFECGS